MNRFKDKNPSPLNNLDYLLGHTYNQIIQMGLEIEKLVKQHKEVSNQLGCMIECFLTCLRLKSSLPVDQFEILKKYFTSNVDIDNETGWMESTQAAIRHLLSNSFNSGNKLAIAQVGQEAEDTASLKTDIQNLCEAICSSGGKVDLGV